MPTGNVTSAAVQEGLLEEILAPYKPNCRYLKRAVFESRNERSNSPPWLARALGEFAIDESCYIDDTGHLNSVEVNICYNQIMYVLFARCVQGGILPVMSHMTLEEYTRRQLPDVLIHGYSSTFKSPIDASSFHGEMGVISAANRRNFILFKTYFRFWDDAGGRAEGDVSLALIDRAANSDFRQADYARP